MNTFVTAFIDLRENRSKNKSVDYCFLHFEKLASTGINIHLFLSSTYKNIQLPVSKNIFVEYLELEDLDTYKEVSDLNLQLPINRTEHKDTKNFMILMNAKTELVKKAIDSNVFASTHFAWIDFAINYIFKNPDTLDYLSNIGKTKFTENFMTVPGCYSLKGFRAEYIFDAIHWRFCGGFFLGDKCSLVKFSEIYKQNFRNIVQTANTMIWETNVWTYLELNTDWNPVWFLADHDDSIIKVPEEFFKPA
jgi:hypothetical protein